MPEKCSRCKKLSYVIYVKGNGDFICPECELLDRENKEEKWEENQDGVIQTKKN